ncbi:MAG: sulfatase-like hydrolase/transferase, partial [Planctomycetes bacterium]|nr:sulfatase-like hydrolase/transferase [Planctomycetota bacterium]
MFGDDEYRPKRSVSASGIHLIQLMIRSTTLGRLPLAALFTGAMLGSLAPPAQAVADVRRPNIVFITVDDQTYHFTSAFRRSGPDTTPNLRALAERGVRFTDGIVQAAQCKPSRNSMITGRYPHQLGLYGNRDRFFIPKTVRGFPESLQAAGYYTAYFGKSHLIPDDTGIWASHGLARTRGMIRQFGFDLVSQSYGRRKSMVDARELQ